MLTVTFIGCKRIRTRGRQYVFSAERLQADPLGHETWKATFREECSVREALVFLDHWFVVVKVLP